MADETEYEYVCEDCGCGLEDNELCMAGPEGDERVVCESCLDDDIYGTPNEQAAADYRANVL